MMKNIDDFVNKIICRDCIEVMKDIPDESIDLVLTDPPYGIDYLSTWTNNHEKIANDKLDDWEKVMDDFLLEAKRIMTDTACCCCFCGGGGKMPITAMLIMKVIKHFHLIQTLVWKKFIGLGWRYRPAYENILIFSKSKNNYSFYDKTNACSNVIEEINQDISQKDDHPTQKPVALMEKLILIHSLENDLVLDPFLGSGTTAVACVRLKRRFIGIEISEEYCKIAQERVKREQEIQHLF